MVRIRPLPWILKLGSYCDLIVVIDVFVYVVFDDLCVDVDVQVDVGNGIHVHVQVDVDGGFLL